LYREKRKAFSSRNSLYLRKEDFLHVGSHVLHPVELLDCWEKPQDQRLWCSLGIWLDEEGLLLRFPLLD
jgi:hypothetical protein